MKVLIALMFALSTSNAFAIYMIDGEFLLDGKNLMLSKETFQRTTESGIKDANGYQKYVMQGEKGAGAIERLLKEFKLKAKCKEGKTSIAVYALDTGSKAAIKIQADGKTYFRQANAREDGTSYHIESIENFMNPLESIEAESTNKSDNLLVLTCK